MQGPFEISPDGQKLLFASPRNGNFDIYVANFDSAGQAALKTLSGQTDLSPALSTTPVPVAAAPVNTPAAEAGILPAVSPYVIALAALAAAWVVVEGVVIMRRRARKRTYQ